MDHFEKRYKFLKDQLVAEYRLDVDGIHGPQHWDRVHAFGLWLARDSAADLTVVRWFSLFHDCQRHDEGWDPEHGLRGSQRAQALLGGDLDAKQMELLVEACIWHDKGKVSQDATIGCCWDSDRCDLDRVWVEPRASLMSTSRGKIIAKMSQQNRLREAGLGRFVL